MRELTCKCGRCRTCRGRMVQRLRRGETLEQATDKEAHRHGREVVWRGRTLHVQSSVMDEDGEVQVRGSALFEAWAAARPWKRTEDV